MPFSEAMRITSTSCEYDIPVSSKLALKVPSIKPTVGKFCIPEKPNRTRSSKNISKLQNGSVPFTPASTGVDFVTGITSEAISLTISFAFP